MKTSNNFSTRSSLKRSIVTFVTMGVFMFQTLMPAYAAVISDSGIQSALEANTLFQQAAAEENHLYEANQYIDASAPAGATTLNTFYDRVFNENRGALGEPTYVPIDSGDISTVIPVYPSYKLVGDDLVQSRFIRAQILAMLGRSVISDYQDESSQLNTLYNNAFTYLNNPTVNFGEKLNLDQESSGLPNMVWPELRTINGQEVLVPIVYLTNLGDKVETHEAEIRGNVEIGNLLIDGATIQLGRDAFLNIVNHFINDGGLVLSEGDLQDMAGGTFANISGHFDIGGDLVVGAKSIHSETIVHRYDFGNERGSYFGEVSTIDTDGSVVLRAHEDIVLLGTQVTAGDSIKLGANGDITIGTVAQDYVYSGGSQYGWRVAQRSSVEYLGSSLSAEESIELIAGGNILIDASEIVAGGHIEILAGLGITVQDSLNQSQSYYKGKFGKTSKEISAYKTVAMRSLLDAGKDITLHAGFGDITLKAVDISSTEGTSVTADNGGVNLLVTRENDHYSYSSVKKSLFTVKTVNRGHDIETVIPNTIVGGLQVDALSGIKVEYEGDPTLGLDGQLDELQVMPGLEWIADIRDQVPAEDWAAVQGKYEAWNESNTSLSPAAMALISIAVAIAVGPGITELFTASGASAATVAGSTTLGSAAVAATTSLVSAAALASANALVNGDDPFEAAFEAVTDSDTLRSAAIAAVTAGALEAIEADFFDIGGDGVGFAEQAAAALTNVAVRAGSSVLAAGGDFGDLGDAFLQVMMQDAINLLGQHMATEIGKAWDSPFDTGRFDTAFRYIAHAGAGCIVGGATALNDGVAASEGCHTGALGAVVTELTVDIYRANSPKNVVQARELSLLMESDIAAAKQYLAGLIPAGSSPEDVLSLLEDLQLGGQLMTRWARLGANTARITAGLGALLAGGDEFHVNTASMVGGIVAENNGVRIGNKEFPTLTDLALYVAFGQAYTAGLNAEIMIPVEPLMELRRMLGEDHVPDISEAGFRVSIVSQAAGSPDGHTFDVVLFPLIGEGVEMPDGQRVENARVRIVSYSASIQRGSIEDMLSSQSIELEVSTPIIGLDVSLDENNELTGLAVSRGIQAGVGTTLVLGDSAFSVYEDLVTPIVDRFFSSDDE